MNLALSRAIEEQIWRRPIPEECIHIARRVEGRIFIVGQNERYVNFLVPVVGAAHTVTVIAGAAASDIPIRVRSIGHEGVHVGVDGAGNDPFVGLQTLGNDIRVERSQDRIGLRRNRWQRGNGEVSGPSEGKEGCWVILDRG